MLRGKVEAMFFRNDGMPQREVYRRCVDPKSGEYNPREYARLLGEVGYHTRTITEDDPNKEVTPLQLAPLAGSSAQGLRYRIAFGLGVAWVETYTSSKNASGEEIDIVVGRQPIDERRPGRIVNKNRRTNQRHEPEEYLLAEFSYHESDDRDDHREDAPSPAPAPSRELTRVA